MPSTAAKLLKLSPFIELSSLEGSFRGLIEVYQMIKIFPRMLWYSIFIWKSVLSEKLQSITDFNGYTIRQKVFLFKMLHFFLGNIQNIF